MRRAAAQATLRASLTAPFAAEDFTQARSVKGSHEASRELRPRLMP